MPYNGSGTFSLTSGNPVVSGTTISSTVQNTTMSDVAVALTNCVTRDGQSPPTANIPMGGYKITGLAAAAANGDAVRYEQAALLAGTNTFTNPIGVGAAVAAGNAMQLQQNVNLGTAVASTSGTSIDFTGIPSWAKKVTLIFNSVSTNGTSALLIQIGDGSINTSGYVGTASVIQGAASGASDYTTGFGVSNDGATNYSISGIVTLYKLSESVIIASGVLTPAVSTRTHHTAGRKDLTGTLDRVRFTTVNGTDAFDAGSVNISYE